MLKIPIEHKDKPQSGESLFRPPLLSFSSLSNENPILSNLGSVMKGDNLS